jgi:alkylation response protein AidB-like acyl-CoA dehydrogenase
MDLELSPDDRAFRDELHAAGWLGIGWREAYGGHPGTALRQLLVNEELALGAPGIVGLLGAALVAPPLLAFGSEEQKRRLGMILGGGTTQIQKNALAPRGLGLPRGA